MFGYYRYCGNYISKFQLITNRAISNSEIATALRPFYFVVHPDLFGRHPKQRSVNEESLKHLSAHLEALQQKKWSHIKSKVLPFYVRNEDTYKRGVFYFFLRFVEVTLESNNDTTLTIKKILETCNLSTDYVDNIRQKYNSTSNVAQTESTKYNQGENTGFKMNDEDLFNIFESKQRTKSKTLRFWLDENIETAQKRNQSLADLKEEVLKLQNKLTQELKVIEFRYDCGWNFEHYRGCLKTLQRLAKLHEKEMYPLKGRVVVFAPFTGISLEGNVMLSTGDVLNSWLDFLKNIPKHDVFLKRIPSYEIALSQVLRNIRIARRKFMPKAQANHYAGYLRKLTTTLLDYLGTNKYPKSWPKDLREYEIVVESDSGPLMVNPMGQLIVPAICPGFILVDFITNNLEEAKRKADIYKKNKYIEQDLIKSVKVSLSLNSLEKDDSVTTENMISALERIHKLKLKTVKGLNLFITNYYSILSDGTICIPWDYKT